MSPALKQNILVTKSSTNRAESIECGSTFTAALVDGIGYMWGSGLPGKSYSIPTQISEVNIFTFFKKNSLIHDSIYNHNRIYYLDKKH